MSVHYIVSIQNDKGEHWYIRSGEWSKWDLAYNARDAYQFPTIQAAMSVSEDNDYTKRHNHMDGSSSPPSLIWTGLGICNKKPQATGFFVVHRVETSEQVRIPIADKLLGRQ
jgi:hypothetical protein